MKDTFMALGAYARMYFLRVLKAVELVAERDR